MDRSSISNWLRISIESIKQVFLSMIYHVPRILPLYNPIKKIA